MDELCKYMHWHGDSPGRSRRRRENTAVAAFPVSRVDGSFCPEKAACFPITYPVEVQNITDHDQATGLRAEVNESLRDDDEGERERRCRECARRVSVTYHSSDLNGAFEGHLVSMLWSDEVGTCLHS